MQTDPSALHVAAIYNAAWHVRNLRPFQHDKRDSALRELGLAVREAFNRSEDFAPLLEAVRDALTESR